MSVLALAREPLRDHGLSEVAERMRRILSEACDFSTTITVGARARDAARALREACDEAPEKGWDGYAGAPVQLGALEEAESFLRALPTDFPLPDVGIDPGGEVLLEWQVERRWVFSMTIDADGVVSYAGLYGKNRVHGREHFVDVVPKAVVDGLARLLAKWPEPLPR
ncbi:MAG: hypothetical protein HYY06_16545 [Deltaproteobacteria bacterium]|nr:hypothetical protein [Deltaproteobacteria bacterium]